VRWDEPASIVERAPWDVVLAADVLYERRNVDELLALLPQLGPSVLLADPGRPHAKTFLERAAATWRIEQDGIVHTLTRE
jgi:predicted nicotinamide N-methyase